MRYRREIDGLRAIAILPVVLFHAGLNLFSGGYVGVDIFLVISGYLITTIILEEKEKGTFSLAAFYERRARRILPALFLVTLSCLIYSWFILLPHHFKDFSQSIAAVSLSISNIYFWLQTGYFDTAAELKPLLHTWSLAVEEQYYIFYPLLIVILWKSFERSIFWMLLSIAVVSLLLAEWGVYHMPAATFFLIPTRAWELAVGSLIAYVMFYKRTKYDLITSRHGTNEAFSLIGLLLISYAIVAFDQATPFPGFLALIPVIGTGLIIVFTKPQTILGAFLGTRIMVGIGLISYSAYLWHYPLFVFARHQSLSQPSDTVLVILTLFSFVLAYVSWRFVEMPFRKRKNFSRKQIFRFSMVGCITFLSLGMFINYYNGFPTRIPDHVTRAVNQAKEALNHFHSMTSPSAKKISGYDAYASVGEYKTYVLLAGDSHASALAGPLEKRLNDTGIGLKVFAYNGCPPVEGVYRKDRKDDHTCNEFNKLLYKYVATDNSVEYVILAARWPLYVAGKRFDNGEGGVESGLDNPVDLVDNDKKQNTDANVRPLLVLNAYEKSIKKLLETGKKIVIVYSIPEMGWDIPDYITRVCFSKKIRIIDLPPEIPSIRYDKYKERNVLVHSLFDNIHGYPNLLRVKPDSFFCNTNVKGRCIAQNKGDIFYADSNHLSYRGASKVTDAILKLLNNGSSENQSLFDGYYLDRDYDLNF